jgi:hypothetical protein
MPARSAAGWGFGRDVDEFGCGLEDLAAEVGPERHDAHYEWYEPEQDAVKPMTKMPPRRQCGEIGMVQEVAPVPAFRSS